MTIDQFIRKWAPADIKAINEFQDDLFSTQEGKEFQKVALQVLTYPEGASVKIINKDTHTTIAFYPTGTDPNNGMVWTLSRAVGIQEQDWLWILQGLANYYIKSFKK